jgi:Tfp pilus assembly protein FimT
MSPVAPSRQRSPRTVILGVAGLVVGLVLLVVVFVFAVPSLSESGKVQVKLGSDRFDAGLATKRADAVRRDGPILFSDIASGQNDIFLQHVGDDDATGWSAFDARKSGTSRDCTLKWDTQDNQFNDPCDGSSVAADGAGLLHYKVVVTAADTVVINLNPNDQGGDPTTSVSTTTTLLITGTLPNR